MTDQENNLVGCVNPDTSKFCTNLPNIGSSGVMTFIVNQQGRVYQKDLGPKTSKLASKMTAYDPDPTWTLSPD